MYSSCINVMLHTHTYDNVGFNNMNSNDINNFTTQINNYNIYLTLHWNKNHLLNLRERCCRILLSFSNVLCFFALFCLSSASESCDFSMSLKLALIWFAAASKAWQPLEPLAVLNAGKTWISPAIYSNRHKRNIRNCHLQNSFTSKWKQ